MKKWISVKDKLPVFNGTYIVYRSVACPLGGFTDVSACEYHGVKGWVLEDDFITSIEVTHWMELPESL